MNKQGEKEWGGGHYSDRRGSGFWSKRLTMGVPMRRLGHINMPLPTCNVCSEKNIAGKKKKNRIYCTYVCVLYALLLISFVPLYPTYRSCFKVFRLRSSYESVSLTPTKDPGTNFDLLWSSILLCCCAPSDLSSHSNFLRSVVDSNLDSTTPSGIARSITTVS